MFTIENLENTSDRRKYEYLVSQLSKDYLCKHSVIIPSRP